MTNVSGGNMLPVGQNFSGRGMYQLSGNSPSGLDGCVAQAQVKIAGEELLNTVNPPITIAKINITQEDIDSKKVCVKFLKDEKGKLQIRFTPDKVYLLHGKQITLPIDDIKEVKIEKLDDGYGNIDIKLAIIYPEKSQKQFKPLSLYSEYAVMNY